MPGTIYKSIDFNTGIESLDNLFVIESGTTDANGEAIFDISSYNFISVALAAASVTEDTILTCSKVKSKSTTQVVVLVYDTLGALVGSGVNVDLIVVGKI